MATVQSAGSEPGRTESNRIVSAPVIAANAQPTAQRAKLCRMTEVARIPLLRCITTGGQLAKPVSDMPNIEVPAGMVYVGPQ